MTQPDVQAVPEMTAGHRDAYRAVLDHVINCPGCLDGCETGDRLRRGERESRRRGVAAALT